MIYFDSAYIAKFYLTEPDSARVKSLAEEQGEVGCSALGRGEVAQVFHRKFREGSAGRAVTRTLFAQFEADCMQGLWNWFPLTDALIADTVAAFRRLPQSTSLRTADALHLVTAKAHGIKTVYTNDQRVLGAARLFKLSGKSA